jgi:succinyl-CoA synthetase beta subunit
VQLLEHEAKALAAAAGLTVPDGSLAETPGQAQAIARRLGGRVVVKAQVPAAARAADGGIQEAEPDEAGLTAARLLGSTVRGFPVTTVLVERHVPADRALYAGITVDPRARAAVLVVSPAGGAGVEEHAEAAGRAIVPALTGLRDWHVRQAANAAGLGSTDAATLVTAARALYRLFREQRARLVEANPLLLAGEGIPPTAADVRVVPAAVHARGDGGEPPHKPEGDYLEIDAEGDVGLLTTGAGGSMLLVDLLRDAGLRPIDFCDARTGGLRGDPQRLVDILERLDGHPTMRCLGVNVFAGITKLDEFAGLLLQALERVRPRVPVVVRIEGERVEAARARLTAAGLACARDLDDLVERLAAAARTGGP